MDYLDFEKNIKNTLSSSRKELNMDQLLKDLDIKPERKTRKGFAYIGGLSLIGLLLMGSLGWYFYTNSNTELLSNQNQTIVKTNENLKNSNASSMSIIDSKETNLNTSNNSETKVQVLNNKLDKIDTKTSNSDVKIIPLQITERQIETNNQNQNFKKAAINKTSLQNSKPSIQNELALNSKSIKSNIKPLKTQSSFPQSGAVEITSKESRATPAIGIDLEKASILKSASAEKLELLSTLPQIENLSVELEEEETLASLPKLQGCPTFKDRSWSWSFLPEIGYGWPIKNLEQNLPGYEDLFDARSFNEISLESFQLGGYLELKNHTGLYIKTGFAYATITEQMTLKQRLILKDTVREVINIIEVQDSVTYVWGDVIYETEINKNNKVHYTLHSYDIPVAVGYSHLLRDFTLDFEAGVRFNIMTKGKGRIFTTENQFVDIRNDGQQFKKQIGLGVFAGLYIKKQLSEFGEVYLAPRFVFNTDSVSSNNNPIKQKYHSFGLHLGYVYTFAVNKL